MRSTAHDAAQQIVSRLMDEDPEPGHLFHRLNNQLGIILANAELLEAKATDDKMRARAAQVVASALDAAKELRSLQNCFPDSDL